MKRQAPLDGLIIGWKQGSNLNKGKTSQVFKDCASANVNHHATQQKALGSSRCLSDPHPIRTQGPNRLC